MTQNRLSRQVQLALDRIPRPFLESGDLDVEKLVLSRRDWFAVLGAALAAFLAVLDIQITNASLREIQGDLGLDFSEGGWVSTSYLVAEVAVIPLVGSFSAVFGMRRSFATLAIAFVASSLLCGFSWNLGSMVFFRAIQGLCGGALIPMAFQTLLVTMPVSKRNLGLTIFGLTATLAPTIGPSLGGYLTEYWGWRFAFWLNIVPGALMAWLLARGLSDEPIRLQRLREIDFGSAISLGLALGGLTYCLEEGPKQEWWDSASVRNTALYSSAMLGVFFWRAIVQGKRLLDLSLMARRNFGIAVVMTALASAALYGGVYALSVYLGQVQGYGAMAIGEVLMWVGVPQIFLMPAVPFLMRRIDSRYLVAFGLGVFAWSVWMNTGMNSDYAGPELRWALILRAIGQPLFLIPLSAMGMSVIRPQESAQASALFNMFRNIGGSMGISLVSTRVVHSQSVYTRALLERMNTGDWRVVERVQGLKLYLLSQSQDLAQAEKQAYQILQSWVSREAVVLAFAEVFGWMSLALLVCIFLVFWIRPMSSHSVKRGEIDAH